MRTKDALRLVEPTVRHVVRPRSAISYVGWLGHHNLGDEATYEATVACFDRPVVWYPDRLPPGIVARRSDAPFVLGGGTLIGGRFLSILETGRAERQAVFGSGVVDPEFPHSYGDDPGALARWAERLGNVEHVGVRGPRSRELLAEHGIEAEVVGDPIAQFVVDRSVADPTGAVAVNVGHSFGRMWGSEYRFLAEMVDAVAELEKRGIPVEYFVVCPADLATTRAVASQSGTPHAPIHKVYDSATDLLDLARGWRGTIAVKLHAAAISICAGLPTLAIEYHPKCRDFMRSVGLENQIVRTDAISSGGVVESFLAAEEAAVQDRALERLSTFAARQREFAASISAHFER